MARKRKTATQSKRAPTDLVNLNATIKKLQSQLTDPRVATWLWQGARGVRQRLLKIGYNTLRNAVDHLPLINAIINARQDQVLPYCTYATEEGDKGFQFELERKTDESEEGQSNEKEIMSLAGFIEQTGFEHDSMREDDFVDYVSMIVRETYTIDQIATEIQRNRLSEAVAFWLLDGATILRVQDEDAYQKGIRFVQMIDNEIYNEFKEDEIVFDYRYKRADIRYRGYGYSPVEQAIDVVTTLMFGYNYIRDQLVRDRMPKGFISVMGDVDKPQMDAIRNYWYAAMAGIGGQWNIPILPSGKDGVGMDFKSISQSNRDMEYHRTMMFVSSIVGAVFSMDLAELGIKSDDSQPLFAENTKPRIDASKSRGLSSLLAFIQQHVNKVLRKVTTKYRFKFTGVEQEDETLREDIRGKQIANYRSIDEVREEDGLEPFKEDWSKMPMNVQAVQMAMQEQARKQQEKMQEQGGGFGGFPSFGGKPGGGQPGQEKQPSKEGAEGGQGPAELLGKSRERFRRLTDRKGRTVRILVE